MIRLACDTPILIATEPQDFRKGIDGFAALCRNHFHQNPQSGVVYVFINRSKTMVRLLAYEHNGYWLMTKRLSRGKYRCWPKGGQALNGLMAKQLRCLLSNEADLAFSFNPVEKKSENNA